MKKLFLTLCVALIGTAAYAQKGETAIGVNVGYGTEISNLGIGVKSQCGLTDAIRLEAGFDYFFEKDNLSMWDININAHYLIPLADKIKFYPIVGVTYTNWKVDFKEFDIFDKIASSYYNPTGSTLMTDGGSKSEGKFGVNLGGGVQYDINDKWSVNFEVKYQLISDFNQAVFGLGLAYKF